MPDHDEEEDDDVYKVERSESGSPIYRHPPREKDFEFAEDTCVNLKEIEAHVEKHFGPIEMVYHELISDLVHIDVLHVAPSKKHPYHVLVTSGCSDRAMNVPEGFEQFKRVELLIALPPDWPMDTEHWKEEKYYWPIRWLKFLARFPHEYNTWISWGHTIPHGDPPERIADTRFVAFMMIPAYWLPQEHFQLTLESGEQITFFMPLPLYEEELALKLRVGADELENLLEKSGLEFPLNKRRKNVATKRGWFW